jgi:hypothetical protein
MNRKAWPAVAAGLLLCVGMAGTARADTVYFKNGASMWVQESEVDGEELVVTRGGGIQERIPMSQVDRVEKKSTNMPSYQVEVPPAPSASAGQGVPRGGQPGPGAPGGQPSAPGAPGSGGPGGVIPIPGATAGVPGGPPGGPGGGPPMGPGGYPPPQPR